MADNTVLNTMTGGDSIRNKDRSGPKTSISGLDLNIGGGSEVLDTASALADATANPTTALRGALTMFYNGTTWDRARGDTTSGLWVNIKAAIPAGTNAIGKLAANDGVDIGDVTINNATLAVTKSGTWDITNAGTFAVQDSQVIADNGGFTDGTTKVFVVGYIYDEVAGTALTENDAGAARINANRAVVNTLEDGSTRGRYATITAANALKIDGSGVTQPVSGTVAATIAAGASTIAKAEDVASADADVGVPAMAIRKDTPANTSDTDGDYEMLQVSAGRLWCSATIDAALPAGTNAIGKLAANTGVTIGAVEIAASQTIATTNAGTFTVQDSQVVADNAGFTDGTTKVFIAGYIYDEVAGTALTENDAAAARINVNRAVVNVLEDGATRGRILQ
jgi:hypothetical protein